MWGIIKKVSIVESLVALLVFVLPLIFISVSIVDIGSLKAITVFLFVYLSLFVWSIIKLKSDDFVIPFNLISLFAVLVILVNVLSAVLSDNFIVNFWGRDFGFDNSISLISLFLLFFLGTFVFDKIKNVSVTYVSLWVSSLIVILFSIVLILIPNIVPDFGFFFSNTTNTIGKWFDLGVFTGLFLIFNLVSLEFLKVTKKIKIALCASLVLSLVLLFIIGFSELWLVVGIISLIFFIYFLVVSRSDRKNKNNLPVSSLVVLVISFVVLISGLSLNFKAQELLEIDFVDYRPGAVATYQIIKESVKENPVLGQGSASFSNNWVKNKPDGINLTELWNIDFRYGYGLIPTYFATTGILGILSWILFLGMFVYLGFMSLFRKYENNTSKYIITSSFIASFYLWLMNFIYIPSYVTLSLTFIFSSIFVASLYREKMINVKTFAISKNPKYGFLYIFFIVAVLISSITVAYNIAEKFASKIYERQSLVALQENNLVLAEQKMISSLSLDQNDNSLKSLSGIQQSIAAQSQNNQQLSETDRGTIFENYISNSIQAASAAVEYDPTNYSNFYFLGDLFTNIISLQVEGVSERAEEFMNQARELNPKNPQIPLALARIAFATNDLEKSKGLINEALGVKSNYTDAVYLLSQVNVQEGEVETAIENVRLTTIIRPNDPVTFFQLGLLQYQNEDFEAAVNSFESAVIRNPFYLNAKYFLGLGYDRSGREQDAINQFIDLSQLNPENQEIKFILENLQNGLAPFAGAETVNPPIDDEPENREEPPLDEGEEDVTE